VKGGEKFTHRERREKLRGRGGRKFLQGKGQPTKEKP
jgi:hypothetical protein